METTLGFSRKEFNMGSFIYRSRRAVKEQKGNTEVGQR